MWLTCRSDSDSNLTYQRNDKIQGKMPTSSSTDNKNINFDLEALVKLRRDYSSNSMMGIQILILFKE